VRRLPEPPYAANLLDLLRLPVMALSCLHKFAAFCKKMLDISPKIGYFMYVLIDRDIWHIDYFYYVQIIWSLPILPGNIFH